MKSGAFSRLIMFLCISILAFVCLEAERPVFARQVEESGAEPESFSYYQPIVKRNILTQTG